MKHSETRLITLAHKCIHYGKYEYADFIVKKLLEKRGDNADILKEIARIYIAMNNYSAALPHIQKSFEIKKSVETLKMLAAINLQCKNYEDAAIQFEELTKHEPTEEIYHSCVIAYQGLDIYQEAIRMAKEAFEKFETPAMLSRLFFLYTECGMDKEAIECSEELKKKYPNSSSTYNSLGFLYEAIYNDYENAKKCFTKSAKMGFKDAYYNLGVCCKQSEDFVNAEKALKKYMSFNIKTDIDYNYTMGSIYMAQKKLRHGYKYYGKRKNIANLTKKNRNHLWDGKEYPGKVLYISSEQGYGDNIQFIRYIPLAAKKFKKVYYGVDVNLLELFRQSFSPDKYNNIEIVPPNTIVRYNKFAFIMDLPYLLHMNYYNIPSPNSYLSCNEELYSKYKNEYFNNTDIKIGLCWRAKGMALRDAVYRTIDAPYYFKPLFSVQDVKYYSFQKGDIFGMCEKYPQITDISSTFKTFAHTAAALKNLDILITIDTALAHLAGALGVNTYLLLCHAPDWRWFDNTEKTEWYSSVKLIKQHDRRSWQDVSDKLYEKVLNDIRSNHNKSNH
ncbi:MAG: hypothetical protein LUB59_05075 [Candidatus Gastranaerophilales bacterium]|nr:hypothetical protein [Candidatus Gastranaerophilales bacterium]